MTSRQELMESIHPNMKLDKGFFLKIYGYELTRSGFADQALSALEAAGCGRARNYYACIVTEWQLQHDKELKEVAKWYRRECENTYRKAVNWTRKQKMNMKSLTRSELTELCQKLLQEGVITEPEQFVTVMDLSR